MFERGGDGSESDREGFRVSSILFNDLEVLTYNFLRKFTVSWSQDLMVQLKEKRETSTYKWKLRDLTLLYDSGSRLSHPKLKIEVGTDRLTRTFSIKGRVPSKHSLTITILYFLLYPLW